MYSNCNKDTLLKTEVNIWLRRLLHGNSLTIVCHLLDSISIKLYKNILKWWWWETAEKGFPFVSFLYCLISNFIRRYKIGECSLSGYHYCYMLTGMIIIIYEELNCTELLAGGGVSFSSFYVSFYTFQLRLGLDPHRVFHWQSFSPKFCI